MRVLLSLVGGLCLLGAPATAGSAPHQPSVVRISGFTHSGTPAHASGVVVAANGALDVATSASRTSDLSQLSVQTQLGETLSVQSVRYIDGYDLAILRTAPPAFHYVAAQLATTVIDAQQMDVWAYADGAVPHVMTASMWGRSVQFDRSHSNRLGVRCEQCDYADAGAGIFAKDGSLVGILSARWNWSDAQGRFSLMEGEPVAAIAVITASR